MGHALSNPTNKVSHKGTGYRSTPNKAPVQSASHDRNSGKRTQQLKSKYHSMEDIIRSANNEEDLGSRASARDARPPSRHLTPPKAVGLELPPKPMTPPEDGIFDNVNNIYAYFLEAIKQVPEVIKVKGRGLMLGVEFNFDVSELRKKMIIDKHIFTGSANNKNLLRILPPLTIKKEAIDQFIIALKESLAELKS